MVLSDNFRKQRRPYSSH